ncbi:MAG: hypothetical protein Q7R52_00380 [archaeon]|nr:hypothetical protein [archaeon]
MKILCICNHGNVRSAALARAIKDLNGQCISTDLDYLEDQFIQHEAIAIGAHCSKIETIANLSDWADLVIDLSDNDEQVQIRLQEIAKKKYRRFDIGNDIWGNPFHSQLREIVGNILQQLNVK